MIKRQFYRLEHGDKDEPSSDSSYSSDSDVEAEASENSDQDDAVADDADSQDGNCSTSSGYVSEDSSANEINDDPSDYESEDDKESDRSFSKPNDRKGVSTIVKGTAPVDIPHCVMKFKSVYRCRICPRIICLTDQTMRVHLTSKRHARSEKLMKENRLKYAMNSDGEIENQETAGEMNARIIAIADEKSKSKRKNKGRQRQKNRMRKKKTEGAPKVESKTKESTGELAKKRRKK